MTKGDLIVERGAQRLEELAQRASERGDGIGEWLSEELTDDAAFLRKLKPSLIAARARGEAPLDGQATASPAAEPKTAHEPKTAAEPKSAQKRTTRPKAEGGGPSPLVVIAIALAAGILAAKVVDWRGHAHPRD